MKTTTEYKVYILLYVDDLLLAGTSIEEVEKVKAVLKKHFKMKDLFYIKQFLGMNISQNLKEKKIVITQSMYLKNVLDKFDMQNCKPASTPMDINFRHDLLKRDKSENSKIEHKCRKLIGSLMYAMVCSRPDLCISISILSRYQSCASQELWYALKRLLRYVKDTVDMSLIFKKSDKNENLMYGYVDSDWATKSIVSRLQGMFLNYLDVLFLGLLVNSQQLLYLRLKQNM